MNFNQVIESSVKQFTQCLGVLVKVLWFLSFLVSHLVYAEVSTPTPVEFFEKAENGKQRIEAILAYKNQTLTESSLSNPLSLTDTVETMSSLWLDYGYGINESIAAHARWGYLISNIEERSNLSSANDFDNKIRGLSDFDIYFVGNHSLQSDVLHWRLRLQFALGDHKSTEKSLGPPAEYESNAFAGRTVLNAQLGYAGNFEGHTLGAVLNADVLNNDVGIEKKYVNGTSYSLDGDGGRRMAISLFFEMPSEKILWGVSLGQNWQDEIKIKMNKSMLDRLLARDYYNLRVYSRLDTGPGQELRVSLAYDIFNESGGSPADDRLEEGSAFTVQTSYTLEF